ncbi:hypothetical protein K502DRAFT_344774 [Neoconidiobolus thromboides FSU 785]|nr:hypothetical protein K502DRAFT_344774 [Neoconidiobolus thromboides FSU 785]
MGCTEVLRRFHLNQLKIQNLDAEGNCTDSIEKATKFAFGSIIVYEASQKTEIPIWEAHGLVYNLRTLIYFLDNEDCSYNHYVKKCKDNQVPAVKQKDVESLKLYFNGVSNGYICPDYSDSEDEELFKAKKPIVSGMRKLKNELWSSSYIRRGVIDYGSLKDLNSAEISDLQQKIDLKKVKRSLDPIVEKLMDIETRVSLPGGFDEMVQERLVKPKYIKELTFEEKYGPPIIIVPENTTAHITKYNVKRFLEGKGHKTTLELMNYMEKPKEVIINYDLNDKEGYYLDSQNNPYLLPNKFEVLDNIGSLKPEHWKRVVAVFSNGKDWQFKEFKWNNPKTVFYKLKGYYLYNTDRLDHIPNLCKDWNVTQLNVAKNELTEDKYNTFINQFWFDIKSHILKKFPHYLVPIKFWASN